MDQNPDIALPDIETEKLAAVAPAEDAETMRLAATAASKPSQTRDAVVDAPTVRVPVITPVRQQQSKPRFVWLRYPEFWLIVALAAFLRLWHIGLTSFLYDQTSAMQLARNAWLERAFPVTGIWSSIGTLNAPLSVYLLMPFTIFGKDPLPAAISIALWNVLGVAFCYIFAQRYFGRLIAASGTLLFASCAETVGFSRFIWQQNYLPPVLALWILTLYLGCVNGRRWWFVPHVALMTIAIQLHPTAALLIPVSLLGLLLTPRRAMPSRREWVLAVGVIALLLAPTVLWEYVSRGSDLRALAAYATHRGSFNLDVFRVLFAALGGPSAGALGPQSPYAHLGVWFTVLNVVAMLCFVAGMVVLTERLIRVGAHIWREGAATATSSGRRARARSGMLAIWHGLRAEAVWRAHLLLWLWIVLPIALMLRHSSVLFPGYLLVIYPAVFIAAGFSFQAAVRLASRLLPRTRAIRQIARAGILLGLGLLVLAQAVQAVFLPATIASGSFDAFTSYGYPLAEMQQLDAALGALQREQGARAIFVSLPQNVRYRAPLDYLTVSEHADRVGSAANCLVLPAPTEQPALVVATLPAGPANSLITSLPELSPVANLSMAGSGDIAVYQMNGTLPVLLGERPLTPITFADAAGNGLRLEALAMQQDGMLRLRWTVLGSAPTSRGTPWYRISSAVRDTSGGSRATPGTDCQPTRWHAGETVFTWVSPGALTGNDTLMLQVRGSLRVPTLHAGPLRLLAGNNASTPTSLLRPSSGPVAADGTVAIPLEP
ncbi:MAG TPA: glycosyltransferase family 39 protein [Ktedonobacterales bacterium]|nr:glycosyltransferase family 39 protein [Ktedonobacterales bacterium]